jgi:hypothetical protein
MLQVMGKSVTLSPPPAADWRVTSRRHFDRKGASISMGAVGENASEYPRGSYRVSAWFILRSTIT